MSNKVSDRQREAFADLITEEFQYTLLRKMRTLHRETEEVKSNHAESYISEPLASIRDAVLKAEQFGFNLKVSIQGLEPDSDADTAWNELVAGSWCKFYATWQLRIDLLAKVWIAETTEELQGILLDARKQLTTSLNW